ncbi:MAG: efflux RND transporter periplasmic adaptor subunit [Thermoanaerobaculia bacterium]
MSPRIKVLVVIGVAAVIGVVFIASVKSKDKNLVRVSTAKVGKSDLVSTVNCNGRVQAKTKVDISSQVMGQIVNLAVREGDVVKKGDFLLQIDKAQFDASARAQQAGLEALFAQRESDRASRAQAQRDYEREQKNFEGKISSEQALQKARQMMDVATANENATDRRIEQSRAQLTSSKDSLNKTTITAPIAGIVTARPVEAGENAMIGTMNNPGTVLLTISDMSVVEAQMEVDETDMPHVKVGQKAQLTVDAYPEKKYEGIVTEIGGSPILKSALGTDSSAVNFKVKVQLKSPPTDIRPGFSVAGQIETDKRTAALAIPIPALVVADEATLKKPEKGKKADAKAAMTPTPAPGDSAKKKEVEGVFIVKKDGTVDFHKVKTGINAELQTEVVEGLTEGEEIITGPFKALRSLKIGDRVKVDNSPSREDAKKS